jgi:hypothetical protein
MNKGQKYYSQYTLAIRAYEGLAHVSFGQV